MDFEEGIHKSSSRKFAPEPDAEPERERQPRKHTRWLRVLTIMVLVCIVIGGVIAWQIVRNQHTASPTTSVHHGWCSVPVIGLNANIGVPLLNGIDAVSARDIWMVGYLASQNARTANEALIEHWNGTNLSVIPSPNSGKNGSRLQAITEITPENVWAVGSVLSMPSSPNSLGGFLSGLHTLIEHWDGRQWSVVSSPDGATGTNSQNELRSIAAVSASDIWAVGYSYQNQVSNALIEHWNGHQWNVVNLPGSLHATYLQQVVASSENNIWIDGYSDAPSDQISPALLAHWDGSQWNLIPGLPKNFSLLSLQASSPHDIWLAGEIQPALANAAKPQNTSGPTGLTIIAHWNGTSLQQQTLPKLSLQQVPTSYGATYQDQASVFVNASNDIWVAGGQSNFAQFTSTVPVFIKHWDGKNWKAIPLPQAHVGQLSVLSMINGKVWAAGTTYDGLQQIPDQLVETTC